MSHAKYEPINSSSSNTVSQLLYKIYKGLRGDYIHLIFPLFVLNRRWIKEERGSECFISVTIREITCTDCDNPLGKKIQTNFVLFLLSHLRAFLHLPIQTKLHRD